MKRPWNFLFCFLIAVSSSYVEGAQKLEVLLDVAAQLPQVYCSALRGSSREGEELRALLVEDLKSTGHCQMVSVQEKLEQAIAWPSLVWKGVIPYAIALEAYESGVHVWVLQSGAAALHLGDVLFGDRKKMHNIVDAIQKELFHVEGICSQRVVYSVRAQEKPGEWRSDLYVADFDGKNVEPLRTKHSYCLNPGVIPGSEEFFFTSSETGQMKLYRYKLGGHPKLWVDLPGNQLHPAVSSDGRLLSFISDVAGRPDLFVQRLDKEGWPVGKPEQIFSAPYATQASPVFSPDGKQIAFVSDKDGTARIYILELGKENVLRLVSRQNRENTAPAWSPDGTKLAYSARTGGVRQIWIYEVMGGREWQLTEGEVGKENPSWAKDSLHLLYNTENGDQGEVFRVDVRSKESVLWAVGGKQKRMARWW